MELIKKYHQKIISYGLIVVGAVAFLFFFILHLKPSYYWCSAFSIVIGTTLLFLAEDKQ